MNIQMIAMDLDGTALRSDHMCFTPRLSRALENAHHRGVAVVPVTGRQYALLPPPVLAHPLWEGLAALCNGAQIRRLSDGAVLQRRDVPARALAALLELADRYALPIEFSIDGTLYLTERSREAQLCRPELAFHRDTVLAGHSAVVDSLLPLCEKQVEKVNLLCIPDEIRDILTEETRTLPVSAVWSSASGMEITHAEATKGRCVEDLCGILGIPLERVMAIGDSGNDETMLRLAGLGVAMGNAPEYVRRCADAVTLTNTEDGAAIAIERYVLGIPAGPAAADNCGR